MSTTYHKQQGLRTAPLTCWAKGRVSGNTIIAALRARRMALDLTQQVVADRIGVDVASLLRWEQGKSHPGLFHVENWARVLELKLSLSEDTR